MQVENVLIPDTKSPYRVQNLVEGFEKTAENTDSESSLSSQVLQLKWQLFHMQKSQQELASAILQLSNMIVPPSQIRNPSIPPPTMPPPLGLEPAKHSKRKWGSRLSEIHHNKQAKVTDQLSPKSKPSLKVEHSLQLCQCSSCSPGQNSSSNVETSCLLPSLDLKTANKPDTYQLFNPKHNQFFPLHPQIEANPGHPLPNVSTSLDLYISFLLKSLENKSTPLLPPPATPILPTATQQVSLFSAHIKFICK